MYDAFIQAKHFTVANRDSCRLIVIHTMEAPEKPHTARSVARWFAGEYGTAPLASAHVCIDDGETIGCVKPEHVAWHAPGANRDGYGMEHAGYARQKPQDWGDDYSDRLLARSAIHAARICRLFAIPAARLTPDGVKAQMKGFCGHVDVNRAYKRSTHTDPGLFFPWDHYLHLVRVALEELATGEELDALEEPIR